MKPLFPAHRAAEEFASVIDGHPSDETSDRYASLAAVVTLMRTQEHPEPRPEFAADLRSRLMLAAEAELVPAPVVTPARPQVRPPRRRERRLAAAAAALVLVGSAAGMATAAQRSVPGDPLYPLKLGMEQASVALHSSDAGKGADLLGQADTRLSEVQALVADGGTPADIGATLQRFQATAGHGADLLFQSYQQDGDDASIATVRSFATDQMATLARLAPTAPAGSASAFQRAADTVAAIDQQARVLCVACSQTSALSVPGDLIGPTSAASLTTLIQHPAQIAGAEARAARALATAAQEAGHAAAQQPSATGSPDSTSGTQAPPATGTLAGTTTTTTGGQPVKDLVDGVTKKTGGLTNGLTDAVKGTTGNATGGVDATTGAGGATGDLGDTVTGTVGGLLGGLTGP